MSNTKHNRDYIIAFGVELVKILLEYEDEGEIILESVWTTPIGEYFRIDNIPFYAESIAFGDLVSAKEENGELIFDSLIEASGHSVIQIIFYDKKDVDRVTQDLINLGCEWEGSHIATYIAVDVPPSVPYKTIQAYLDQKTSEEVLGYKEACLGSL